MLGPCRSGGSALPRQGVFRQVLDLPLGPQVHSSGSGEGLPLDAAPHTPGVQEGGGCRPAVERQWPQPACCSPLFRVPQVTLW